MSRQLLASQPISGAYLGSRRPGEWQVMQEYVVAGSFYLQAWNFSNCESPRRGNIGMEKQKAILTN